MSDDIRTRVTEAVKAYGGSAVAKALGLPRNTLLSWLGFSAREGTNALVMSRADRLEALLATPPARPRQARAELPTRPAVAA